MMDIDKIKNIRRATKT